MIDWDDVNKKLEDVEKRLGPTEENIFGNMTGYEFSIIMQKLLLSKGSWIIDVGNYENVNYACMYDFIKKIKKHPIIWKLFFMLR